MKESIHKYFKVGVVHFMSFPQTFNGEGPIVQTLQKILEDDYFDAVEISWIKSNEVRSRVRRMLDEAGITVCYGAQPRLLTTGFNPNAINEEERLKAQATLIEAIDEASYLGAKGIAFFAGRYEEKSKEQAYRQLVRTTKELCAYAKEKCMSVELEVFDYDIDKKSLIGPAPLAARFAAEISESFDNFGLLVDLSHIPQTHETSRFVIRTLRPYITHLHIGSAVLGDPSMEAYGDTHPRFNFPNSVNSVKDLVDFLKCLKDENLFNQDNPLVLSFEVKPWKEENPEVVIANTKRVLNRAWALLDD
ncbi:MAG: sugar phosphate isomerase/epimerase family protein [Acetivibrionales bacterium]